MHIHITGLDLVDLSRFDPLTAYRCLAEDVRLQVWKIAEEKFLPMSDADLVRRIRRARIIQQTITVKEQSNALSPLIRNALTEYIQCLSSWCEGADLEGFLHRSKLHAVDGTVITSLELGLAFQDEYSGCQTGAYRDSDGSIIFWHMEEASEKIPQQRFDRFRLAHFTLTSENEPVALYSFIYPDLLPGPSFAWRSDGYVQMVDFLFLQPDISPSGLFANLATWITLRLGMRVEPAQVIKQLAPYYDGYSLMYVHNLRGSPATGRIEYAANRCSVSSLGSQPGSFLFQVNIFSAQSADMAPTLEKDPNPERQFLVDRIQRTENAIRKMRATSDHMRSIHRILKSKDGGPGAYSNPDVKAHLIGRITPTEIKLHPAGGIAKGLLKHR